MSLICNYLPFYKISCKYVCAIIFCKNTYILVTPQQSRLPNVTFEFGSPKRIMMYIVTSGKPNSITENRSIYSNRTVPHANKLYSNRTVNPLLGCNTLKYHYFQVYQILHTFITYLHDLKQVDSLLSYSPKFQWSKIFMIFAKFCWFTKMKILKLSPYAFSW